MNIDIDGLPENISEEEIEVAISELIDEGKLSKDTSDKVRSILKDKIEKDRIERIRTPRSDDRIEEYVIRTEEDLNRVLGGIHGFIAAGLMAMAFGGRMEKVFNRIVLDVDDDIKRMGMRYAFEAVFNSTGIRGIVVDEKTEGEKKDGKEQGASDHDSHSREDHHDVKKVKED